MIKSTTRIQNLFKSYLTSESHGSVAVACLTDVKNPSDVFAGVHDMSDLCCGLYFESDNDEESPIF